MAMRPKSTAKDLPPRMVRRIRRMVSGKEWVGYYYNSRDDAGRRVEIPLGKDLNEAKRKWAELECKPAPAETGLMRVVFDRYERDIIPTKAPRTQRDNKTELAMLRAVFDTAPINAITTQHLAQYRDRRGQVAAVRANRELALFSHAFNMAREWGYTAKENPCRGLRKNKETPRNFYADDAVFQAVFGCAAAELQDAMQLAYLSGQRPADVRKMRWADIQDGFLCIQQNKTGNRLRVAVEGELDEVLSRIRARKVSSMFILCSPRGQPFSDGMLRIRFDAAREEAAKKHPELASKIEAFQFRDIRAKAASDTNLEHASALLGHTEQAITKRVYARRGAIVRPLKSRG